MNSKVMSASPIGHRKARSIKPASVLALVFLALLAVAAVFLWQAPAAGPAAAQPPGVERFLAQNPELSAAQRYALAQSAAGESRFLAQNPELMVAARYAVQAASGDEAAFRAQNPELSAARRYAELFGAE